MASQRTYRKLRPPTPKIDFKNCDGCQWSYAASLLRSEVYRGAPGLVSMAGLPERHAPGRVVAVEGGIEARLGASSTAGSTDAHDRHRRPTAPDHARRPPRRCRAAARPHHL